MAVLGGSKVFSKSTKIYVPANLLETYKTAEEWNEIADQISSVEIQKGDVNGDGELSVEDVAILVEFLQGRIDAEPWMSVIDVDRDGELTEMDCTMLADMIVTRDIESYGDITVTWKYPNINTDTSDAAYHIGYDGGESTPLITKITQRVKYNNNTYGTITIFENSDGVLVQDLPSNIGLDKENIYFTFNESYPGITLDSQSGKITAVANTDESPDFRMLTVSVTGTLNGVRFETTVILKQDTGNRYVWYGYSDHVPTSFNDKGTSTSAIIGTGPFSVTTTREHRAHCHWIMIPQGSGYSLDRVIDDNNGNVTSHYPASDTTFTDGTTNYTMYYLYVPNVYYSNTSNFYLTHNT